MTELFNEPKSFGEQAVAGFSAAHSRYVQQVRGGVIRSTADIAFGPASDWSRRRGIAGDPVVFKVAGAAAEAGRDLDGAAEVAQRANERTRTLGVAFWACTLPGATSFAFLMSAVGELLDRKP